MPIRWKIAAASTVATMLLLLGAGLIFLTTLRSGLQSGLDNSLRSKADELISQVDTAGAVRTGTVVTLSDNTDGQVIAADGTVLHTTSALLSQPLVTGTRLAQARAGSRFFDVSVDTGGTRQVQRVLAVPLGDAGLLVAVGISRDVVDEAVERAGKELLLVGGVVFLIVAPGSWLLARGALAPVEHMRAQAADLQASDAGGGLTVPNSRDEISRLGSTLNELLGRLHSALARERAFVADAGHELRTPLTVLRGELELARRPGRSRDELLQTVEIASEETERLIRLAEDLLVLARDESADGVRWIDFDLMVVLRDAAGLVESLAVSRSVEMAVRGPDTLIVPGDPDRIRQAVDNLVANALRFSPAGGQIVLKGRRVGSDTLIEVVDDGPGFPPELLANAFERFRRADRVRTRGSSTDDHGTGLGLAIVAAVLRGHGGVATAANRTDRSGARLVLRWPDRAV